MSIFPHETKKLSPNNSRSELLKRGSEPSGDTPAKLVIIEEQKRSISPDICNARAKEMKTSFSNSDSPEFEFKPVKDASESEPLPKMKCEPEDNTLLKLMDGISDIS